MKTHIHTPGPFHITQNTTPGQFGTETKIRSADNSVIAVLHVNTDGNGPLIASAPDLLDALKLALPCVEYAEIETASKGQAGAHDKCLNALKLIRAAIAKAEGNA